jgi:hypothetical protein
MFLTAECERLRGFIDKLSQQRTANAISELSQTYRIEEHKFSAVFQGEVEAIKDSIDVFVSSFQVSNERFESVITVQEPPFSKEERELYNKSLEKMNAQVNELMNGINGRFATINSDTMVLKDSISQDFDRVLPFHRMDVEFLEKLFQCQSEARSKYKSLQFKNNQSEEDIHMAIKAVISFVDSDRDTPRKIEKLFEVVDLLRIAIIRRSQYLGILRSVFPTDPIALNLDVEAESAQKKQKAIRGHRSSVAVKPPPQVSLLAQIDQIGTEFVAQVTTCAANYYKRVKARKFDITRIDIQPTQKDCVKFMKKCWANIISDSAEIVDKSSERLRLQEMETVQIVRAATKTFFECVLSLYEASVLGSLRDVKTTFNQEMSGHQRSRRSNVKKLTPRLADVNREDAFSQVLKEEQLRAVDEQGLIQSYNTAVIDTELAGMKNFMSHLPAIVKTTLLLFDSFVMKDDLISGRVADAERQPLIHLMRDQARRQRGAEPIDEIRPFRHRNWPQLNLVMVPMEPFIAAPEGSHKGKRPGKGREKPVEEAVERTMKQKSLDTPLSRGVIVERNLCYDRYERDLGERMSAFKAEVEGLLANWKAQTENWRLSVLSLKPEVVFALL